MEDMKKIWKWIKEQNETIGTFLLIIAIWYLIPPVLRNTIDPQAGEFGSEVLYVPFIAIIYSLIGLLFVWYALRVNFPKARKLLDDVFEMEELTLWEKLQFLSRLVLCLIILYAVSLLAVTGISVIM
jgi:hypothetical protein